MNNPDDIVNLFASPVYIFYKPEFLSSVKSVSERYLKDLKKENDLNKVYPLYQTENMINEESISDFVNFIKNVAENILFNQGYNINNLRPEILELWCQEHFRGSGHERHIHGNGSYITGFYITKIPKNSTKFLFHDPRPAKEFSNLPESNADNVTNASQSVFFKPQEGTFLFTNSWLPHTIARNESRESVRIIHFNVGLSYFNNPEKSNSSVVVV